MEKTGSKHIEALIAEAVAGNGRSFTELWDTYIDQLRSFIKTRVRRLDDMDVDDICSRSFEKAFRQIESFDASKSVFFTWLSVIARNTALDYLKAEGRQNPPERVSLDTDTVSAAADEVPDTLDSPLESIIRDEDDQKTRTIIDGLPELYREVARLRLLEGMQYKEISDITGLELNTVRTRIRRSKALIDNARTDENDD